MSKSMKSINKFQPFLLAVTVSMALAGCSSTGEKQSAYTQPTTPAAPSSSIIGTSGIGNQSNAGAQALQNQGPDLSQHSLYFQFNKSAIEPQYQSVIDNWSKYLIAHPSVKVQLQGNTDDRGTSAYNLGLGERRADAVRQAMMVEGVSPQQMSVVSYGEERPVCTQQDEACWKQNRRVDIIEQ